MTVPHELRDQEMTFPNVVPQGQSAKIYHKTLATGGGQKNPQRPASPAGLERPESVSLGGGNAHHGARLGGVSLVLRKVEGRKFPTLNVQF